MGSTARRHHRGTKRFDAARLRRLRARRSEVEEVIAARVQAVEDPTAAGDPEYARGLQGAVGAALGHAIAVLESGGNDPEPIPVELIAQARMAARNRVALDTVLLRYLAGHAVICDYLLEEAASSPTELRQALRTQTALLERVLTAVTSAYRQEVEDQGRSTERRHAERVRRLLAGEPQDALELGYDLDLWHLGVLASGVGAPRALRELAAGSDRRLLLVRPGGKEVWAWLGGRSLLPAGEVIERVIAEGRPDLTLSIGEPGFGASGWRLSHRQARAALPIALRSAPGVVRYADVALLASALEDEVLAELLSESYLRPLALERDGGAALRQTVRAYFSAERNVTATAASLGVSRPTVQSRLRTVEERIGRRLGSCAAEIETALRLEDLDRL